MYRASRAIPYVLFAASAARKRPIIGVQPLVESQMNVLSEFGLADFAVIGFGSVVQTQVGLQVRGRGESLVADLAPMGTLP